MADSPRGIRPAVSTDLPAVLALYAQPEMDAGAILPIAEAERLFARITAYPDYTLYVAEQDGRIVGTFALLVMDNLGHLGAPSAVVEDVVVAPDRHGDGIGQEMMRFAIERARAKDCYKVMLSSDAKRERAQAFYERLGFARHGTSFRLDLDHQTPRGAPPVPPRHCEERSGEAIAGCERGPGLLGPPARPRNARERDQQERDGGAR